MLNPLFAGITSFILAFAFLPFIIKFSKKKSWSLILAAAESIKK